MLNRLQAALISLMASLLILWGIQPAQACVEGLAGLRARHGSPLSTSSMDLKQNEQIWVWNTGEDLITAVKHDGTTHQQFVIAYRPSRLRPETL